MKSVLKVALWRGVSSEHAVCLPASLILTVNSESGEQAVRLGFSRAALERSVSASPMAGVGRRQVRNWGSVGSRGIFGEHQNTKTVRGTAVKGFVFPDRFLYPEFQMLHLCLTDLCFSQMLGSGVGEWWARCSGTVSCKGIEKEAERDQNQISSWPRRHDDWLCCRSGRSSIPL